MSPRQLRVALEVLQPEDLPERFDLRDGLSVTDRRQFVDGLRVSADVGAAGWRPDLEAALGHLNDPKDFGRRYDAAGGTRPPQ